MRYLILLSLMTGCASKQFCKDMDQAMTTNNYAKAQEVVRKEVQSKNLEGKEAGKHIIKKLRSCGYDVPDYETVMGEK